MSKDFLFTSESVSAGHPDKIADQISDAILDDFLRHDPVARVACETFVTTNLVVVGGEIRSTHTPDYDAVIRQTIKDIGYTVDVQDDFSDTTAVINNVIHEQSPEIATGVDAAAATQGSEGAGDQGLMFGYASNETDALMPAPIFYAHEVLKHLTRQRQQGGTGLRPDAKSQVTLEYRDGKPVRADTLLVSHQHDPDLTLEQLTEIVTAAWHAVMPAGWIDANTRILVNPTKSFVVGGPAGDAGLTGRKIIVDTYGGMSRHGGGAFSGKDPTKVDRSAAYAARYLAKNIVAAELADCCEIQVCYAIGVPEPLAVYVDTFGTAANGVSEAALSKAIYQSMDLTPKGIRTRLQLNKPIFLPSASFGHFGRNPGENGTFSWEKTDLVDDLHAALKKVA